MKSPHVIHEACHAVKLRTVALLVPPSQAVAKFREIAYSREKAPWAFWGVLGEERSSCGGWSMGYIYIYILYLIYIYIIILEIEYG